MLPSSLLPELEGLPDGKSVHEHCDHSMTLEYWPGQIEVSKQSDATFQDSANKLPLVAGILHLVRKKTLVEALKT